MQTLLLYSILAGGGLELTTEITAITEKKRYDSGVRPARPERSAVEGLVGIAKLMMRPQLNCGVNKASAQGRLVCDCVSAYARLTP